MITFNNIPTTLRTPGVYTEIDNSRALKGLLQNPHKALIIGQKESGGSASTLALKLITNDNAAAGFFGAGTTLDRMCRKFKLNNPNTEMWAIALSENAAGVKASGVLSFAGSATANGTIYLLLGGVQVQTPITSGWSATDVCSAVKSDINANTNLCIRASFTATQSRLYLLAVGSGEVGNYFDARLNYYDGQVLPTGVTYVLSALGTGSNNPTMADVWAVIDGMQFNHIIHPYGDAANLTTIENELTTRFGPMVDMQGFAYTATRGTYASCAALGLTRNSPHQAIIGAYDSPSNPDEWAAVWGAQCAFNLNNDAARPVHMLTLKGILPPTQASGNRFTRTERNQLLYDGIATWIVDSSGNVMIERSITSYRTNALGLADPSYLDIETMFTLIEIRYQYNARMVTRFILPRFKLADDNNPIPAGAAVATPSIVKQEVIALFTLLRDNGLIENLDEFIENVVVERDTTDVNRVNVLLPPDLINQFRILAGTLQFIL